MGDQSLNVASLSSEERSWTLFSDTAVSGGLIVFLAEGDLVTLNPDPAVFAVGIPIVLAEGSFEFHSIHPYDEQRIIFSGLNLTDGAAVTDELNIQTGEVNISSADASYDVIQLEQIN